MVLFIMHHTLSCHPTFDLLSLLLWMLILPKIGGKIDISSYWIRFVKIHKCVDYGLLQGSTTNFCASTNNVLYIYT